MSDADDDPGESGKEFDSDPELFLRILSVLALIGIGLLCGITTFEPGVQEVMARVGLGFFALAVLIGFRVRFAALLAIGGVGWFIGARLFAIARQSIERGGLRLDDFPVVLLLAAGVILSWLIQWVRVVERRKRAP